MTPKLFRRIAWEGFDSRFAANPEWFKEKYTQGLAISPIFVVDDAAKMFLDKWKREDPIPGGSHVNREDACINAAPPFDSYWMEATDGGGKFGALFVAIPLPEGGWETIAAFAADMPGEQILFPFGVAKIPVAPDGRVDYDQIGVQQTEGTKNIRDFATLVNSMLAPLLAVHGLMHCKNVECDSREIDPADKRKMEKRFGTRDGGYRFHTLVIKGKQGERHGLSTGTGETMPLHVCRGHYKTYTVERPLLGKFTGRFFWHDHVRGDPKRGIVGKDYEVRNDPE
jgi:hypothetical protein